MNIFKDRKKNRSRLVESKSINYVEILGGFGTLTISIVVLIIIVVCTRNL